MQRNRAVPSNDRLCRIIFNLVQKNKKNKKNYRAATCQTSVVYCFHKTTLSRLYAFFFFLFFCFCNLIQFHRTQHDRHAFNVSRRASIIYCLIMCRLSSDEMPLNGH